jgi:hypothetical protein
VQGFSNYGGIHILAAFLSMDWLSDLHETFMLEVVHQRVGMLKGAAGDLVAGVLTSHHIHQAYQNCNTREYPPAMMICLQ